MYSSTKVKQITMDNIKSGVEEGKSDYDIAVALRTALHLFVSVGQSAQVHSSQLASFLPHTVHCSRALKRYNTLCRSVSLHIWRFPLRCTHHSFITFNFSQCKDSFHAGARSYYLLLGVVFYFFREILRRLKQHYS